MHPYQPVPPASAPAPRRRLAQLWLPALCVLAAVVATVVYLSTGDDAQATVRPDGTADRFYAAVNAHDKATWSGLLCHTSDAAKLSRFSAVSLMTPAAGPSVDGTSATAKGRFRLTTDVFLKQFRDYDFTISLTRSGRRWCVAHLTSTPSRSATGPSPFPPSSGAPSSTPSTSPTTTPPATPSTPTAPSTPTSSTSGSGCHVPPTASPSTSLVPPTVLKAGLDGRFATPTLRYTLKTVSTYCYDDVEQGDLRLLLAYLGGAYTAQPVTRANQQTFTSSSTAVPPSHTVVTVNGSLRIPSQPGDTGRGSVEVDWY